jgi:hypothetical protein
VAWHVALSGDQGRPSANLRLNTPVENIDNRVRLRPLDHVGDPWGVVESL